MFEKLSYCCPACNWEFQDKLETGKDIQCPSCSSEYRVLVDADTGRATLLVHQDKAIPEPLFMPRGSIRALVALTLAGVCWALVFLGRPLPETLLALLLTVLGYYFGFRKNARAAQSAAKDASAKVQEPLNLPGGTIRVLLMAGFGISALVLYGRGQLTAQPALGFYMIVAGLLVGHLYGRATRSGRGNDALILVNHLKGLAVLVTAGALAVAYLSAAPLAPLWVSLMTAVVSFYYGSR